MRILVLILSIFIISNVYANALNTKLTKEVNKDIDVYNMPSMVLSVSLPEDTYIRTFVGQSKVEEKKYTITTNSLYEAGSITKLYLSVLLLKLQQQGLISINQTIGETINKYGYWAPKNMLDKWKNITLKQLLNMTSGIYSYTDSEKLMDKVYKNPKKDWNDIELLSIASNNKAYFEAGTGWHYSNTNYILLGMLISKIENKPLEEIFNDQMFSQQKLNLLNTFYPGSKLNSVVKNRLVPGYDIKGDDMKDVNLTVAGASGAIISNAQDLVKFVRVVFNSNYLGKAQLNLLESVVDTDSGKPVATPKDRSGLYGLGVFRSFSKEAGPYWIYEGKTFGYEAEVVWAPCSNIVFAITINKAYGHKHDPLDQITENVFSILMKD
jgi:D-alanyl-D-alanine carboxypeptidase